MLSVGQNTLAAVVRALTRAYNGAHIRRQPSAMQRRRVSAVPRYVRYATCILLVFSLLVTSTPTAARTIVAVTKESSVSLAFWFRSSGWQKTAFRLLQGRGEGNTAQESQQHRDARVSRIQIYPGNVTVGLSEHVWFSAIAYDQDDTPVSGVKIKWRALESVDGRRARISGDGEFEATTPGSFNIEAEGAGRSARVSLVVRPGIRRDPNAVPIRTRRVSTRDLPPTAVSRESNSEGVAQRSKRNEGIKRSGTILRAHTARSKSTGSKSLPAAATPLLDDGWGDSNYWSVDDPINRVGNPPGGAMDEGAGSGNFQMSTPLLALPGRGIDMSLGLAYNSRVWNKAGSQITYDIDRGWPAPGWSLGFSKILGMGVYAGGMLVEADGTRHASLCDIIEVASGTEGTCHTTDGTLIDYKYVSGIGGPIIWAEAKLPNGTVISYGAAGPGAVYPTRILDPNGNYITITYVNNAGPRIETVLDTLGRSINFHYDANNLLTAITGPGLNNGVRTLVRLHYRQLALSYSFSGLTHVVRDSNPWVIDAIYYPATNTGFWFGDTNSYSTYGMLAKVSERRNMTFSAASLNEQGTITSAGDISREEVYSYPLTTGDQGGSGLTDAPTYTTFTERWTRDGVNIDQAVTTYAAQTEVSPRTMTITLPNGTQSVQYSHKSPGTYLDGLVYEDRTLLGPTVLQSSTVTWEEGAYHSPRPLRVEVTNEREQTTKTEFSYGDLNQVTEVRNYDFGGSTVLRTKQTQYQNSGSYTSRHIFNLPLVVEIFTGYLGTRVSKTEYQYDGQPLTATPDVEQHALQFNPYALAEGLCYYDPVDPDDPDCHPPCHPTFEDCDGHCPQPLYHCYVPATDYRGNVTQITSYADAANLTGPLTETRRYDVTGNLVTAGSTSCCEQTSFNYTLDTQYAYPLSQTHGSATDPYAQVKTSSSYDFNTGVVLSTTDANGRVSQATYFPETLRPQTVTLPTNAHTDYAYDDSAMTVTETTYLYFHPVHSTIADQTVRLLNGRGQVRQEKSLAPGGVWDLVDVEYGSMGEVLRQSAPYRSGSPRWTSFTYDALGRKKKMIGPDYTLADASDGSATESFYNEVNRPSVASTLPGETTRVHDPWGRERWGRTDALGRLVELVEPNPSGSGSVFDAGALVTTYTYNTLGNLIQVNQGAQVRSFKYDSLGRLTAQKLAETSATLNDAGTYVGAGTWSDAYTYDNRSNLNSRTDARGVKTLYNYNGDPLNRLQSVSWDTSGFGDTANPILSAATVTFYYRMKTSGPELLDVTQLSGISAAGVSSENYFFDVESRVNKKILTLTNRPNHPLITDYLYDAVDRIENVTYPAEYGNGAQPRKVVHHNYDVASRLDSLTVDGALHASNIVYNAASQTTSLNVGATGPNQMIETYSYDAQTGLLNGQKAARFSSPTAPILDLSYDHVGANGKRTGLLTKILNNLNHAKDRSYTYDALGRLVQAKGGPSGGLWTQTYTYDRYGNRTSVSASGYSATLNDPSGRTRREGSDLQAVRSATESGAISTPANPGVVLPDKQLASRGDITPPNATGTDGLRQPSESNSHHASRSTLTKPAAPQGGPPVFTDDPLVAGVTTIKALHITELRTAINQARSRAALPAASWAEAVSSGGPIKAAHIVEMRARLDEARAALGLSVASYTDPTLTVGVTTVKAVHIQQLRERVTEALTASLAIPVDGHANLSYDPATNRITTAGFAYDAAGNQVRALAAGGGSQRFQYDAANRLVKVKTDDNQTVIASYTYGNSNERLIAEEGGLRTYYAADSGTVLAEYVESGGSTTPVWSKSYIYLEARLLSTLTPNGSGGEFVQYHHPDRLGTRLITNAQDTTSFEQVTLPFGTPLTAESSGATNRRFTSYERSVNTGLDYAINRHYDPKQGRFTQVDPIDMEAVELENPQTLNLYGYCANDPVNSIDPSGLGFFSFLGRLFRAIWRVLTNRWFILAVTVALTVISFGSSMGWWALSKAVQVPLGIDLGYGVAASTYTIIQTTTLGWISAALSTAIAIPALTSVRGILQQLAGFGIGQALGSIRASVGAGTPDWNPDRNDFKRRPNNQPRRGQPGYRGPGSWYFGLGRPRIPRAPMGYSRTYPRDYFDRNTVKRSAQFNSEGEARAEAFRMMGTAPVKVAEWKWRSLNGRWQYRAKPGDLRLNHIHLERLDPASGRVLENWHLTWPAGQGRR